MGLKLYLFGLYFEMLLSLGLVVLLLTNVNPYQAPFWILAIFYLCIFFLVMGIFAIVLFHLKVWASNREVIFAHLTPTLRQSAILGLIAVGLLLLQQVRTLNWWSAGLLVTAFALIELFFRSKR